MKKIWGLVVVVGVVACASAVRNTSSGGEAPGDVLQSRFIRTTTGTVESYTADESIVLRGTDGADLTLPLDAGARVDAEIATGQMVTVAWLTDSLGRPRVTSVAPFSAPAAAGVAGGSASSAPPSRAYASATDGGAMSATPTGPLAGTPRAPVTAPPGSLTPGPSPQATPLYPVRPTPPAPSR